MAPNELGVGHGAVSAPGLQQTACRPATWCSEAFRGLQVELKIAHSRQLCSWQRRRETCSVLDQVFWNIWTLILVYIQLNVLILEMWLIFGGHLWYSIRTSQIILQGLQEYLLWLQLMSFIARVISHYQQKKWYDWLNWGVFAVMCIVCGWMCVWYVWFCMNGIVCMMFVLLY